MRGIVLSMATWDPSGVISPVIADMAYLLEKAGVEFTNEKPA
jgi:hypothetical protein